MVATRLIIGILLCCSLGVWAGEPLKIGVITDTHYLSEKLMDDGNAVRNYSSSSSRNVKDVPFVLDKVLADYLNSDIQILLVSGDITKDGEKQSHIDFLEKLKPLQAKGVKVYVIPGNHDINVPHSIQFKGDGQSSVDNITPRDFEILYADCGYNNAISRDTASLSYVVSLNEDTWLLAIDAARYKEYTSSSITAGKILPATEKWIVEVLDDARKKNIQVVGMMHWGLTEHIVYQSMFFKEYLVDDWQRLANLFADKGMKAVFTGHFHSNDISLFTSDEGNKIYDIATGALCSYPFAYRFIELSKDGMKVEAKNITGIPQNPNLAEEGKQSLQLLAEKQAVQKLKRLGYDLPQNVIERMASVLGQIFIIHVYGDEKMTDSLKKSLSNLSILMDEDMPIDYSEMELDFPPADNNVELTF